VFYSDRPIEKLGDDQLNRGEFSRLLAQALMGLKSDNTYTVGLFGEWGSGKTSVVNMTLSEIERRQAETPTEKQLVVVRFEPWNFSGTDQLLNQFFIRLANELRSKDDERMVSVAQAIEKYSKAFSFLKFVPEVGNVLADVGKTGAQMVAQIMKKGFDDADVQKQKEYIIDLIKEQPNQIMVVIDDIDRLTSEQIRCVFQLISSVAKFPNMIYLLVFDKEIVVKSLENVQSGSGEDYLEKIIQTPIEIPEVQKTELRKVLFARLDTMIEEYPKVGFVQEHWQRLFDPCVAPFIKNIRDINRLCNALEFKLSAVSGEIDFTDLVAISILEIHLPQVYDWVKKNKDLLTGREGISGLFDRDKSQRELYNRYFTELGSLSSQSDTNAEQNTKAIVKFLSCLFPFFGNKIGETYETYNIQNLRRNNLIAHPEKVDRYFQLSIGNNGFKTEDVLLFIEEMDVETAKEFLLEQDKHGTSYEFLEDVMARAESIVGARAKTLVKALIAANWKLNQVKQRSLVTTSSKIYADHLLIRIIEQVFEGDRIKLFLELLANAEIGEIGSIANVINMVELGYGRLAAKGKEHNYGKVITLEELEQVENAFCNRMKTILSTASIFDDREWQMIYYLLENFEPEYAKEHLGTELKEDLNVLKYLPQYIACWTGRSKSYVINSDYTERLDETHILSAIHNCREDGALFDLPEETLNKCVAFFLSKTSEPRDREIEEGEVQKLLDTWRKDKTS